MNRKLKTTIMIIAILLLLNALLNIIDDSRLLTFDITSILAGIGFIVMSRVK